MYAIFIEINTQEPNSEIIKWGKNPQGNSHKIIKIIETHPTHRECISNLAAYVKIRKKIIELMRQSMPADTHASLIMLDTADRHTAPLVETALNTLGAMRVIMFEQYRQDVISGLKKPPKPWSLAAASEEELKEFRALAVSRGFTPTV